MPARAPRTIILAGWLLIGANACKKENAEAPKTQPAAVVQQPVKEKAAPTRQLLIGQSQFVEEGGKLAPGPAKLVAIPPTPDAEPTFVIEDPTSNVFHKVIAWRGGILTIGGTAASLRHWRQQDGRWQATTLWEKSWGGKFDRLRDFEVGDLDGDDKEDIALATHDRGVVAVGTEAEGQWTFREMSEAPDTFVHEVEIGDVDGDGLKELYATVSERNRSDQVSQPGGVYRYDLTAQGFVRSTVVEWKSTHAKEILVADIDRDGRDELYVAREAETKRDAKRADALVVAKACAVQEFAHNDGAWKIVRQHSIDDKQIRFLVSGDVDGDGNTEMVAAAMTSGLWLLRRQEKDFAAELVDADTGGFEHATHLADLDGDGLPEIYVAADKQGQLRRYAWQRGPQKWDRQIITNFAPRHITWSIGDITLP